jgi:heptosyltransferase-3
MNRILVVATRQIGDVLLTTPLIRAARQRWPQARIDVLGFAGTLGMLRGNPDIGELIESPPRPGLKGLAALARRLWRRYDLALVTQPGDRAHLIGLLAARKRSGIVPAGGSSSWWKTRLLHHAVHSAGDRGKVHVVAEKLALLAPWLDTSRQLPAVIPPAAAPLPAQIDAQLQPGAVVMHVPSMWAYKQWPVGHFRAVAEGLLAKGRQVVLTGAPQDRDCIAPLLGLAQPPRLLDACGHLDFNQLTGLLGKAALYIGPDTSVSHLAAAAGLPVIAIFGPTNPLRWRPWTAPGTNNVTVLQTQGLSCVPCSLAGCENHTGSRSDCLLAITPEAVLARALELLQAP